MGFEQDEMDVVEKLLDGCSLRDSGETECVPLGHYNQYPTGTTMYGSSRNSLLCTYKGGVAWKVFQPLKWIFYAD